MIYVVTGFPRSGTSLMMHILGQIGIPLYYSEKREQNLLQKSNINNPYFYEDSKVTFGGFFDLDLIDKHAVKIFVNALLKSNLLNRDNCKVIYMYRNVSMDIDMRKQRKMNKEEFRKMRKSFFGDQRRFMQYQGSSSSSITQKIRPLLGLRMRGVNGNFLVDTLYLFNTLVIDYNKLVDNPEQDMYRLQDFLGVNFDIEAVASVVDVNLRHFQ